MHSDDSDLTTRLEAAQDQLQRQQEQLLSLNEMLQKSQKLRSQLQEKLDQSNEDGVRLSRENQLLTAVVLLTLQQAKSDDADSTTRLEVAQDQIELQQEQLLSSNGMLQESQKSRDQLQEELDQSNEDGVQLNRENQLLTAVVLLNLHQAKSLAKRALAEQETTVEALAWLLSKIYRQPVTPSDLGG